MREKKYAHILEEYEEQLKNLQEETKDVEDSLDDEDVEISMTREIKYKDLQDVIDKGEEPSTLETTSKIAELKEDIAEVEDILENTDHLEALEKMSKEETEETKEEEKKEDSNTDVKIEQVSGKSDMDDIYLTTSFQPFKKRFKITRLIKRVIVFILVLGLIGGIGYFGVYPLLEKYVFNTPKRIFENSIDYVVDLVNNTVLTDDESNEEIKSFLYNYKMDIKTNLEGGEFLNDYDYELKLGSDFKQNSFMLDLLMVKDNNKVGLQTYMKDKKTYVKYSTDEKYMLYEENGEDVGTWELEEAINGLNQVSLDDLKYYVTGELEIFKSLLDEKYLSKAKDEITIDGKSVQVTRNTLKIDQETAIEIEKKFYEKLKEDKKLLEIYATMMDSTVSEAEDFIDSIDYEETYDEKYDAAINIYTVKGNEFVGVDYEENGFRLAYYYRNDYEFDLYLNLTEDEDCKEGADCVADNKVVFQISGETKDDVTEVVVKYNNKKIATLNVREFTDKKIDLDYEFTFQGLSFDGFIKVEVNGENSNIDMKVNFSDFYIEVICDAKLEYNKGLPKIGDNDYVPYSEAEDAKRSEVFEKKLEEMGILKVLEELFTEEEVTPNNPPQQNVVDNTI